MTTVTDELKRLSAGLRRVWAGAMGVVLALVVGVLGGVTWARGEILEDCKYAGAFRVHTQSFTCVRRM